MNRLKLRLLIGLVVAVALAWGATLDLNAAAKAAAKATAKAVTTAAGKVAATVAPQKAQKNGQKNGQGQMGPKGQTGKMRSTTPGQRLGARMQQGRQKTGAAVTFAGINPATTSLSPLALAGTAAGPLALATMNPLGTPDYFGVPNWANSPLPVIDPTGAVTVGTGLRKFIDPLPDLKAVIATPDTTTFPGSDYYEIALVEYHQQMHSDLPAAGTQLRGYVQTNGPLGTAATPSYLGPVILAQKNRPVRVKFTNMLPTGAGGNLFIPTDTTYMGAGNGADGTPYTQNRATLHLHGGNTPWISDGTPHQWTAPAGETTNFKKGVSTGYVPDMWFDSTGALLPATSGCQGVATCAVAGASNNPGDGAMTFYWTNQQSGRLLFYHDHAYGITRLNVYAGEAAGYLLYDPLEEHALAAASVPGTLDTVANPAVLDTAHVIPLVIQDKTFVPDSGNTGGQLASTDPTWDVQHWGGFGNLWYPHVYTPNQNPMDPGGSNGFGRWDYGPWFWPAQNPSTLVSMPIPCPNDPTVVCPGTPNPSGTPEAFMDTPVVNGKAYPKLTVDPAAYRFHILSVGNDRTLNLGLYVAEPLSIGLTAGGTGYTTAPTVAISGGAGGGSGAAATAVISTGTVTSVTVVGQGAGYLAATPPAVTIAPSPAGCSPASNCATATATVDPVLGTVLSITVTNGGTGYTTPPAVTIAASPAGCSPASNCATATALVAPTGSVYSVVVTNPGSAPWTAPPTVSFSGGGGTGAAAIASVNTEVHMVPAVQPGSTAPVPPCSQLTPIPVLGLGLGLATSNIYDGVANITGLPPNCWPVYSNDPGLPTPAMWPTDGRAGGVPDPLTAGPPFVQIGSEGGLLPSAVVIPSTPLGYEYNRRSITVTNISTHGLTLGPAERADAVVDFSKFAGKTLIMYNDAPAPVPAFDPRTDYYTGDPDQTPTGGAPTTLPGYGPNTRTIMQIVVNPAVTTAPNVTPFNVATLQAALPSIYSGVALGGAAGSNQANPVIPLGVLARIQDTSLTTAAGSVSGITLNTAGSNFTSAPGVMIYGGGGTGATATASLNTVVKALTLTAPGSGYTSPVTVNITGGGGTGATATATILANAVGVASVTVNPGSFYSVPPAVSFSGGGGSGAAATAALSATGVSSLLLTNPGSGFTTAPSVVFTGGGATAPATATASLAPTSVGSVTLTAAGSNYTAAPLVTFTSVNGLGSGAAATALLTPTSVGSVQLAAGSSGFTSVPTVTFSGGGGTGAAATAALTPTRIATLTLGPGGSGYTSAPTVGFSGGGAGAIGPAVAARLSVNAVGVTVSGSGYTTPPSVAFSGGGGSGATGTAVLAVTSVRSINVTNGGSGYTSVPTVTISGGGGTGATAVANIRGRQVQSITVTNGGINYTTVPTVTITGGGGTGATATANLRATSVAAVTVNNGGGGYTSSPAVSFSGGGGRGAAASATMRVSSLQVTLPGGSGFTSVPTVVFTGGGGSGAGATATLTPTSLASLTLTNNGSGYTSAPAVGFITVGGGTASATATLAGTTLAGLSLTAPGVGYTVPPTVSFSGTGTGATATATLTPTGLGSLLVTFGGTGYTSVPAVSFSGGGGRLAAATAIMASVPITVTVTSPGSGYLTAPSVNFTGGTFTTAATGTANLLPQSGGIATVTLQNAGTGYSAPPTVSFTGAGGSGTGATATASLVPAPVSSLALTNGGSGYTGTPLVTIFGGGGTGATASATLSNSVPMLPKAIQELFTLDYGRMNATLGVELPFTNFATQTTIPYGYVDPPTEIFKGPLAGAASPQGEQQVWKITHNGVDTHFIHFHLFNVQVINRVGWDGTIRPIDANEYGWKDTVRMNPLEDIIVAINPIAPVVPWDLPNSIRTLDVTQGVGYQSTMTFANIDPNNQPVNTINDLTNFGWEYVWHCHILGHEENDMMRPMIFAVAPAAPTNLAGAVGSLSWTDNSLNETGFTIQSSATGAAPWTNVATVPGVPGAGTTVTYTDNIANPLLVSGTFYQVIANNVVGYGRVAGYQTVSNDSQPSNVIKY